MTPLRRLAVVTTVATYVLVTAGGLVRATSSGLGCPDWPKCHGSFIPPADFHAIVEWSHRFTASVVIFLTLALAGVALATRRRVGRRAVLLALVTVPIVFSQALLGALVVALDLHAESVVGHLAVAMTLVAVLIALVIETGEHSAPAPDPAVVAPAPDRDFARKVAWVAYSSLALLLLGSLVSGRGAGLVYGDWPLFDGRLLPSTAGASALAAERMWLHFAHRVLAGIVVVAVVGLLRSARRTSPVGGHPGAPGQAGPVIRLIRLAAMLIGAEVLLGAGNVLTELSPATRTAHLALGALVWGTLFAAACLAGRLPAPGGAQAAPAPGTEPAREPAGALMRGTT